VERKFIIHHSSFIIVYMAHKTKKEDPLGEKSFQFAVRMFRFCRYLAREKNEFVVSKQIVRSGTNPGAMVREAANAESGPDFIHNIGWNCFLPPIFCPNRNFTH